VIGLAGQVFLRHTTDSGGVEDAGGCDEGGLGQIKSPRLQILLEPSGDRHGEAGLFALKNRFGKVAAESFAQDNLGLAAAQFVVGTEGEGMGDEIDVEERNSHFEGVGHGCAVDLHEDALLEVKFGAEVKKAFQTPGEAAALGQAGDVLKRIGAVELVAGVGGKKIPTFRVAAGPHPEEETNFRGKAQAFDKLSQEERETFVVVGDGKTLDDVVDRVADGYREKGKAFQKKVGLETRVAGKQLIPAIPAQHGFDLGGSEPRQKPGGDEGGVAEGFVQSGIDFRKGGDDFRRRKGLMMVFRADPPGHLFGKRELVVGGFGKTNGEGVELFPGQGSGQGGDGAGVDAAAEQDPDLDIAAELVADGLLEEFAGFLRRLIKGAGADRIVLDGQVPEVVGATSGRGPGYDLSRLQLADAGIGRGGGRNIAEGEILIDRGGIEARA